MAERILAPGDIDRPRVVTMRELVATLAPSLWSAGVDVEQIKLELHDLWRMGAPDPQQMGRVPIDQERRILVHTQFNKWWREVCARHNMAITPRGALDG